MGLRTFALVTMLAAAPLGAQNPATPISRLQNRFRPTTWIHNEQGAPAASPIQPGWWSADWFVESSGTAPFVRIRSRFHPDQYLHIERGRLESSTIDMNWHSAQWQLVSVPGTAYVRIRNRWKSTEYLHTERDRLESGTIDQGWWSAMWTVTTRPAEVAAPAAMAAAPGAAKPGLAPGEQPLPATAPKPSAAAPGTPALAAAVSAEPNGIADAMDVPPDVCTGGAVCSDQSDPTRWRLVRGGAQLPGDAYIVGSEPSGGTTRQLGVCVAYFRTPAEPAGRRFIGKTGSGFEGCNVPSNGRELVVRGTFLVLVTPLPGPSADLPAPEWLPTRDGYAGGITLRTFGGDALCRARHEGGVHPGRLIFRRGCAIPYGDAEVVLPTYEVLARQGGS